MIIFTKGEPFPDPIYKGAVDSAVVQLMDTGFNLVIFIDKPTKGELESFATGKLTYGIYQELNIPFMTIELPYLEFNASFNIKNMENPQGLKNWLEIESNAMTLVLVNSSTYLIEQIRLIGLNHEFVKDLHDILRRQDQQYPNKTEVLKQLRAVEKRTSLRTMSKESVKYRHK
ncbi:hypothetical protein ACQKLP_11000 [Chitinophaga sp. NPDC101104]|uniref:hypothetical protein n=1 Tax=Chitinophaga sp. NPDC101104 TaxID=3390561 RepID=UPI003CFEB3AE